MEEYKMKLEYFQKNHPNQKLGIDVVDIDYADKLLDEILEKNDIQLNVLAMRYLSPVCNMQDYSPTAKACLAKNICIEKERVYVYNLNFMYCWKVTLSDFIDYFDYIWYPSSDDIIVFSSLESSVYYVDHDGNFYCLAPKV